MPFNAAGVFSLLFNWPSERDQGEFIAAGKMENQQQDIANAISQIVDGTQPLTGTMTIAGGAVSQPAYSFTGDTNTGIYQTGQDSIGISCGGVNVAEFNGTSTVVESLTVNGGIAGVGISESDFIAGTSTTEGTITAEKLRLTINNFLPAGMVMMYASNPPPSNWLECDGSAISRTDYSALFSAIGTTYGEGDGSTTFNLPDLRGEFVRGWDNGRGIDDGRSFGSYQGHALEEHQHSFEGYSRLSGSDYDLIQLSNKDSSFDSTPVGDVTGATTANETRPRNIALMYCIKI